MFKIVDYFNKGYIIDLAYYIYSSGYKLIIRKLIGYIIKYIKNTFAIYIVIYYYLYINYNSVSSTKSNKLELNYNSILKEDKYYNTFTSVKFNLFVLV